MTDAHHLADGVPRLAHELDEADRHHRPLPVPGVVELDLPAAYAVQDAFVALRSARLRSPVRAYKVALTSAGTQAAVGAAEPASGALLAADVLRSGAVVTAEEVNAPVVEVELAFRVVRDLPAGADIDQVVEGTEVAGALECPDSRYRDWFGGAFPALALPLVVADDCLAGRLVVGERWRAARALDLETITAELHAGDGLLARGRSDQVLGHPAASVVWLLRQLAARGRSLPVGTVVSVGTLTPPVPFRPGSVRATFSGGLGEVDATVQRSSV